MGSVRKIQLPHEREENKRRSIFMDSQKMVKYNLSCRGRDCLVILFSVISNAVRNLSLDDKEGSLRFATFLQNDTFTSYGTVLEAGIQIFQTAANTPDTGACPRRDPGSHRCKVFLSERSNIQFPNEREEYTRTSIIEQKKRQGRVALPSGNKPIKTFLIS